jgi:hypothetical protein
MRRAFAPRARSRSLVVVVVVVECGRLRSRR